MENSQVIRIEKLVKRFPMGKSEFTALNDIGLILSQGDFAGLIGPSGSGKTTLLNIIGSLDMPTSGEVTVLGHSIGNLNAREAASLRKRNSDSSSKAIICWQYILYMKMLNSRFFFSAFLLLKGRKW